MKKELRQKQILKRKNFFPSLIITMFLWITLALIVYFTDPKSAIMIFIFFLVLFMCLFFTASLIFVSKRRGIIIALALTFFALLKFWGVGNLLNFILIVSLLIVIEAYFWYR